MNKGFTLIGVMVASVIGLIVLIGLSSAISGMQAQVRSIELGLNQNALKDRLFKGFPATCKDNLKHLGQKIKVGGGQSDNKSIQLLKLNTLRDGNGDIVYADGFDYDLNNVNHRKNLQTMYGIGFVDQATVNKEVKGITLGLYCFDPINQGIWDGAGASPCKCVGQSLPCEKTWILALRSMTIKRDLPYWDKPIDHKFTIIYEQTPNPAGDNFVCGATGSNPVQGMSEDQFYKDENSNFTNAVLGKNAGKEKGKENVFIGFGTGKNTGGAGMQNVFIGHHTGHLNTTGKKNVFIGKGAGHNNKTGEENIFIGQRAGQSLTNKDGNIFIGNEAGQNTHGEGNIFIGNEAGQGNSHDSNRFVVGTSGTPAKRNWLKGEIGTDDFTINNKQVCFRSSSGGTSNCSNHIHSSKTLKKKIKPFKDFKKAMDDILKTPLFTYQYKDKDSYPKKKRMGVIAEELPKHLQLKDKNQPPQPDWPSIYGTFWGAIKALYEISQDKNKERAEMFNEIKSLKKEIKELKTRLNKTEKKLEGIK